VLRSGTAGNVVPAEAVLQVDVRAASAEEQARVDEAIHALVVSLPGTTVDVAGSLNRPPLASSSSVELFARASRLAVELGLPALEGAEVGGGSDGNFTAGLGIPTLDGLGAVGGGAHAEGEHVVVDTMEGRTALLAALIRDIRSR
jgi:glutamate carboxypeptidase